jgi:hypothetical protein
MNRINAAVIRSASSRIRQLTLSLLTLVVIGYANLTTDLTGREPKACGITQLGRDISRKSLGEAAEQQLLGEKGCNATGA